MKSALIVHLQSESKLHNGDCHPMDLILEYMIEHRQTLMQVMLPLDMNVKVMNQYEVSRVPWVSLLKMAHPPKHLVSLATMRWMTSSQRPNDMIMQQGYCAMGVTLA